MGAQERNDPEPARASALSWREGHGWGRTSFAASDGPVSAELRATGHVQPGARSSWAWVARAGFQDDGGFARGGAALKLRVTGALDHATEAEAKAAAERAVERCRLAVELSRAAQAPADPEDA